MRINGKEVQKYGGSLISKSILPCSAEQNGEWMPGALLPLVSDNPVLTYSKITAEVLVTGRNLTETTLRTSNLISETVQCRIDFNDLDYGFDVELMSSSVEKLNVCNHLLTLEFRAGPKSGPLEKIEMEGALQEVGVSGNTNTPVVLELMPGMSVIKAVVAVNENRMEIRGLEKGQMVKIDGEKGCVTGGGKNKYIDTDISEFPVFTPGINTVSIDKASCKVTIKFRSRWK